MHDEHGRRVVNAAVGRAAIFGSNFSFDTDHCRRAESFAELNVVVRGNCRPRDRCGARQGSQRLEGRSPSPQSVEFSAAGRARLQSSRYCPMAQRKAATRFMPWLRRRVTISTRATAWWRVLTSADSSTTSLRFSAPAVVDVKVPSGLKVGYIMGAGDDIPTVLRQLGLDVTLLTPDDVEHGDLAALRHHRARHSRLRYARRREEEQPASAGLRA